MEPARFPVKEMESVVATVTGYHGGDRFNLIKLIDATGANYVGSMYRGVTHLICGIFEGRKYELARKFQIKIVNHRWIEECVKQGRRVPEEPYTCLSGADVGSLCLDFLLELNLFQNKQRIQTKCKKPVINIESEDMDGSAWANKTLLNELDEPSTSRHPHSSTQKKRESTSTDHIRKHRRLVKKQLSMDNFVFTSNVELQDQSRNAIRGDHKHENRRSSPDVEILRSTSNNHGSDMRFFMGEKNNCGALHDVGVIEDVNDGKPNSYTNVAQPPTCKISEEHCEAVGELFGYVDKLDNGNRQPASNKLSCVICWTDFSTTRGVLPCGHRFCFSCIQDWAHRMVSKSKPSTCPLCKASFTCIRKLDDAVSSDQKIYSQTIPGDCSNKDIHYVSAEAWPLPSNSSAQVCCQCSSREPEDLLIKCNYCQIRCVHCYCLDPLLLPWTCVHCKDLQMLYYHTR